MYWKVLSVFWIFKKKLSSPSILANSRKKFRYFYFFQTRILLSVQTGLAVTLGIQYSVCVFKWIRSFSVNLIRLVDKRLIDDGHRFVGFNFS